MSQRSTAQTAAETASLDEMRCLDHSDHVIRCEAFGGTCSSRRMKPVTAALSSSLIILPRLDNERGPAMMMTAIPQTVMSAPAAVTTGGDEMSEVKATAGWRNFGETVPCP